MEYLVLFLLNLCMYICMHIYIIYFKYIFSHIFIKQDKFHYKLTSPLLDFFQGGHF